MENINDKILEGLNEGQKEAVLTTEGPLLIVAGAGSGKTTVLIRRVANIVSKGVEPKSILLLTFTNAAANNMIERAKSLSDERCGDVQAMTYHSFCAMELRKYAKVLGISSGFSIYSSNDAEDLMKYIRSEHQECKRKGFPTAAKLLSFISESVNKQEPLADVLDRKKVTRSDAEIIFGLADEYKVEKMKRNALDYDDLLSFMALLLKQPGMTNIMAKKWNYVMVDEYQDTNSLQADILFGLAGTKCNIAVVGDDYQSIYAFRGADITNILGFENQIKERFGLTAKRVYLEVNYRSNREILDLANSVMAEKATSGFKKTLRPRGEDATGLMPQVHGVSGTFEEGQNVLSKIRTLLSQGVPASEIAVLSRSSMSTASIETGLTGLGLDYIKRGGIKFLEKKSIRDIIAYLSVISNPLDDTKWFRLLKLHPGIGDAYAKNIVSNCADGNFLMNHKYTKRAFQCECLLLNDFMEKVRKEIDFHVQMQMIKDFYITLEERVIRDMDTDEDTREQLFQDVETWKEDIDVLMDMAAEFNTITAFLDYITIDPNLTGDEQDGMITVSTIHSAKGLEWGYVFILDVVDGMFPKDCISEEEYQEELRCFYVAITRAKYELHLYAPQAMLICGQFCYTQLSSFLSGSDSFFEGA